MAINFNVEMNRLFLSSPRLLNMWSSFILHCNFILFPSFPSSLLFFLILSDFIMYGRWSLHFLPCSICLSRNPEGNWKYEKDLPGPDRGYLQGWSTHPLGKKHWRSQLCMRKSSFWEWSPAETYEVLSNLWISSGEAGWSFSMLRSRVGGLLVRRSMLLCLQHWWCAYPHCYSSEPAKSRI